MIAITTFECKETFDQNRDLIIQWETKKIEVLFTQSAISQPTDATFPQDVIIFLLQQTQQVEELFIYWLVGGYFLAYHDERVLDIVIQLIFEGCIKSIVRILEALPFDYLQFLQIGHRCIKFIISVFLRPLLVHGSHHFLLLQRTPIGCHPQYQVLREFIERSEETSSDYWDGDELLYQCFVIAVDLSDNFSDHYIFISLNFDLKGEYGCALASALQLTNMTSRNQTTSLPVLAIKGVLSRVVGQVSMRSLTAAIRQHCLQGQSQCKDLLLGFFLACESKLKRSTQQEWNRVIDNQIRRMVGLELVGKFMASHVLAIAMTKMKQSPMNIIQELEGELGQIEISQEVHLKTKYFCHWLAYLQERREVKRLKNKEVEDVKKSRVFCQYSLKFQTFLRWKQHTRKTNTDRAKAKQIQQATIKRLANAAFVAFKEKIDILTIQAQLAQAVSTKIQQFAVRSVFVKLQQNREKEQNQEVKQKNANIWLFRFYKFITQKCHPLLNLSSVKNRQNLQRQYQRLSMELCWKGFKKQLQQTNNRKDQIRKMCRNKAIKQLTDIQSKRKNMIKVKLELSIFRKSIFLKELMQNISVGSQKSLKYSEKINAVHFMQKENAGKYFLFSLKQRMRAENEQKQKMLNFYTKFTNLKKKQVMKNLSSFKDRRGQYTEKQRKVQSLVGFKMFMFRHNQYHTRLIAIKQLHASLSRHHNTHLLFLVFQSFSLYKSVTRNQYESISNIISSIKIKKLNEAFQQLREKTQLIGKLGRLVAKSEWVIMKVSFVTILNRMLSNKMKIKAFYQQQEVKLKGKLFDLLKRNSEYMAGQREQVERSGVQFAKARLVRNLKKEVALRKSQEEVQIIHQKRTKYKFYEAFQEDISRKYEIQQKLQQTSMMLASNRMIDFASSAKEFLLYRQNENKLIYKLQKALVRGIFKNLRKRMGQIRQTQEDKHYLQKEHKEKTRYIQNQMMNKCLVALIRSKPSTLKEKETKLKQLKVRHVLSILSNYHKQSIIRKQLKTHHKIEFLSLLQTDNNLAKCHRKFTKKMNKQKTKQSLQTIHKNTIEQFQQRQQKSQYLSQWLLQSRYLSSKQSLIASLTNLADLKQNSIILMNTIKKNCFERFIKQHLKQRSKAIKEVIALRLYSTNLKRRALRGLRRVSDVYVLKENRARTEHHSKLSAQKSMEHVRRKSKLLETIERYNHSRISRVVR